MKLIISPAKQMEPDLEAGPCRKPQLLEQTKKLYGILSAMSKSELRELWCCNERLANLNYLRLKNTDLEKGPFTPAILSYVGLQYQHMGPKVLDAAAWDYVCKHVNILSGFYGVLRADDGVVPYRLEMQALLETDRGVDLYHFWGDRIYRKVVEDDKVIINLASKEYSAVILPCVDEDVRVVTVTFVTFADGKYKTKATEAKMARGSMVRWCAENNITEPEQLKDFDVYGYKFMPELSDENNYFFNK